MQALGSSKGLIDLKVESVIQILADKFQDLEITKDETSIAIRLHRLYRNGKRKTSHCFHIAQNQENYRELIIQAWRTIYSLDQIEMDISFTLDLQHQEAEMLCEFMFKPMIHNFLLNN